jgi:UDP-3-O-[3-hydroxymyristoyl] glucosamine N-acyltransferase
MTLQQLADRIDATVEGDGSIEVIGIASLKDAGPGEVSFVASQKFAAQAQTTTAAALIVETGFPAQSKPTLRVANAYLAAAKAIRCFYTGPLYPPGIHPAASVAASATLGARAHVGACAVIGEDVVLGDDAVILPHAVLYPGVRAGDRLLVHSHAVVREFCRLGDDVTLQNGAIIGADGFGFARDETGWVKIPQSGIVELGDGVEVQANACIDRATLGSTVVAAGAKIDNLVQVGHGSTIGEHTMLCAQVGMAGSGVLGKNVILAGQVGVNSHITVGDGVIATGQTGITHSVEPGKHISGNPAQETRSWLKATAAANRLPELLKQMRGKS